VKPGAIAEAARPASRVDEYAVLLDETTAAVRGQLVEARLALHIVLEQQFGPLNDHQEELLESARASMVLAEDDLRRLQQIAELDHGSLAARRDNVNIGDVVRALQPGLEADASHTRVALILDIAPALRPVPGDRVRLQLALALLLGQMTRRGGTAGPIILSVDDDQSGVAVAVTGALPPRLDADVALASRIIAAHGGTIETRPDRTVIVLPRPAS
jgi:signal transduction histidine kinase